MREVEIYDPESPAVPSHVLAANFDPRLHVRWEYRPAVLDQDWTRVVLREARGDRPVEHVSAELADRLRAAGFNSVLDVLSRGSELRALTDVPRNLAAAMTSYCAELPEGRDASAELEAAAAVAAKEGAEEPVTPALPAGASPSVLPTPPALEPPAPSGSEGG